MNCNYKKHHGERFGRLVAISPIRTFSKNGNPIVSWECKCDCGNKITTRAENLMGGGTNSCGCLRREISRENILKSMKKHGETGDNIFQRWNGIKKRVNSTKKGTRKYYFDKGITICAEWKNDYLAFKKWALENGYKKNLIIDRIDNTKGYSPENCRFVTAKQSSRNTSRNRHIIINGVKKTVADWCDHYKIDRNLVSGRLWRGWTGETIFTAKKHTRIEKQKPIT